MYNISFLQRQSLHKHVAVLRYTYIACLLRMSVGLAVFRDVALCSLIESTNIRRNLLPPSSAEMKQRYTYRQKRKETLSPVVQYHFLLLVRVPFFPRGFLFYSENGGRIFLRNLFIIPHGLTSLETVILA